MSSVKVNVAGVRGPSLLSATVQLTLGPFFSSRSSGERRYACRDEQSRLARHELSLPALQPPGRFPGRHPRHPSVAATELYNRTRSTSVAVDRGEQPRCSMGSNIQRLVDQRIQLSPSTDRSPESRRVQRTKEFVESVSLISYSELQKSWRGRGRRCMGPGAQVPCGECPWLLCLPFGTMHSV